MSRIANYFGKAFFGTASVSAARSRRPDDDDRLAPLAGPEIRLIGRAEIALLLSDGLCRPRRDPRLTA